MLIVLNLRTQRDYYFKEERNIESDYKHIDTFDHRTITYNDNEYIYFDFSSYKEIIIECDSDESLSEDYIQNEENKYVLFNLSSDNICIKCNDFQEIRLIHHYYGYKWGPCRSYDNAPLHNIIVINQKDFDIHKDILLQFNVK